MGGWSRKLFRLGSSRRSARCSGLVSLISAPSRPRPGAHRSPSARPSIPTAYELDSRCLHPGRRGRRSGPDEIDLATFMIREQHRGQVEIRTDRQHGDREAAARPSARHRRRSPAFRSRHVSTVVDLPDLTSVLRLGISVAEAAVERHARFGTLRRQKCSFGPPETEKAPARRPVDPSS